MNEAHIHLILNHFPIFGFLFAFLLLLGGMIFKNKSIINAALITYVIVGILTLPAFFSGEEAKEILLKVDPNVGSFVYYHEESAEISLWLSIALGLFSLIVLLINRKKDIKFLYYLVLLFSIAVVISLANTNNLGGKIRHSEIRGNETFYKSTDED